MNPADRDRKKAWKEQERQKSQAAFPLPNELLESLFTFVEAQIDKEGCDHTHRFADRWVMKNKQQHPPIFDWLKENGGFCDCEVVANAQGHWDQNR